MRAADDDGDDGHDDNKTDGPWMTVQAMVPKTTIPVIVTGCAENVPDGAEVEDNQDVSSYF